MKMNAKKEAEEQKKM